MAEELTLAEQMELAALAVINGEVDDCGCGGDPGDCDCDDTPVVVIPDGDISDEAVEFAQKNIVIQLPSIPGTTADGTSQAEADAQKTKRLIYTFGAVLAAMILLVIALAVFNTKNPVK